MGRKSKSAAVGKLQVPEAPRLEPKVPRDKKVGVTFTSEERTVLEQQARTLGTSSSSLLWEVWLWVMKTCKELDINPRTLTAGRLVCGLSDDALAALRELSEKEGKMALPDMAKLLLTEAALQAEELGGWLEFRSRRTGKAHRSHSSGKSVISAEGRQ